MAGREEVKQENKENTRYMNRYIIVVMALCLLASCGRKQAKDEEKEMETAENMATDVYVDTLRLHAQTFHRQMVCNGRLRAVSKSELSFTNGGMVTQILVRNGSRVAKGQLIATTDSREAQIGVERAERDLEKARVELSDKLIGLGYDGISDRVPADVMRRAKVTSGYFSAEYQLRSARQTLASCSLHAPFAGRIADLGNLRYQRIDRLCTLIDDTRLDVVFSVLEAELKNIRIGQHVIVSPFVEENRTCEGIVTDINPTVSDHGLIKVTARIANGDGRLIDGMNVKVVVENDVHHSFVVPKDAVVERDGYHVVFVYRDGEAVWTYVDIAYSNISSYAITGCQRKETEIHEGDIVITSGNLNLADGTKVKLRK